MLLSIVAAVAIFAVLIVVHETGHFAVAKRLGVRVLRFSIGYPPRIFGVRRGETDYALGAVPFGGYVRMLGDEIADEPSADTLKSYLKEVVIDLVSAAKATGWLRSPANGGRKAALDIDEEALRVVADACRTDTLRGSISRQAAGASAAAIQDEPPATDTVIDIIGRSLRPDENLLLREVEVCGSAKLAIETLAENRPSALVGAFNTRAFPSQPLAKRFAIVLAGPFSNILFAPILMTIVLMIGIPTLLPVVGKVSKDMPAFAAGLRQGDRITAVNANKVESWDDLSDAVKASAGASLRLTIARPGKTGPVTAQVTVVPKQLPEETVYGTRAPTWVIGVTPGGDKITRRYGPVAAVKAGSVETARLFAALCIGIAKIFEGATPVRQALGGPIMIAQMAGKEAHQGFADVALFTVMLSLELGIINLLPVPLLDGGHLLFFAIEGIRGKPLKLRHREIAMQVGLFLLAVLMAFVILNDISRIVG